MESDAECEGYLNIPVILAHGIGIGRGLGYRKFPLLIAGHRCVRFNCVRVSYPGGGGGPWLSGSQDTSYRIARKFFDFFSLTFLLSDRDTYSFRGLIFHLLTHDN